MKLAEKYGVSMPIVEQVNKVLFENKTVHEGLADLMSRDKTSEVSVDDWN